jgi:hypothetical protein
MKIFRTFSKPRRLVMILEYILNYYITRRDIIKVIIQLRK